MTGTQLPLLCVLVDALRHDWVNERDTPFLASLGSQGASWPLETILGYSDSIRATVFTGRYPDELGYWMEYRFSPDGSPFSPLSRLGALDRFPSDVALRATKLALSRTVMKPIARRRGYETLDLRHIPFRAMRFFDYTLRTPMTSRGALGAATIFDRLTDAGRPWVYLDSSKVGDRGLADGIAAADPSSAIVFVYLHHLDMVSHLHGIDSVRFRSVLRNTDRRVASCASSIRGRFGDARTLVFSDHGMSRATTFRALPELLRHPGFGSSFCFALDATMARLWYLDDNASVQDQAREIVATRLPGSFLDDEQRRSLHIAFTDRDYGDDIFLVDPGVVIFPNFHSYLRPKAMHAYHPADPDQRGILITDREAPPMSATADLMDVHGAISAIAGLSEPAPIGT